MAPSRRLMWVSAACLALAGCDTLHAQTYTFSTPLTPQDEARRDTIVRETREKYRCTARSAAYDDICAASITVKDQTVVVRQFPAGWGEFRTRTQAMNEELGARFAQAFGGRVSRR